MTEEAALLSAIREHPGDDTPRLVYADWLDDHPTPKRQARAELIRSQCEMARTGGCDLLLRSEVLLKKWGRAWLPKVGRQFALFPNRSVPHYERGLFDVHGTTVDVGCGEKLSYTFRRGFVATANIEWNGDSGPFGSPFAYLNHANSLFAAGPLEEVTFSFENYEPKVRLEVICDRHHWWCLRLRCDGTLFAETPAFDDHRGIAKVIPQFLSINVPRIDFTYVAPTIPF